MGSLGAEDRRRRILEREDEQEGKTMGEERQNIFVEEFNEVLRSFVELI